MKKISEYNNFEEPGSALNFISRVVRFIWLRTPSAITDLSIFRHIGKYFYNRFTKFQSRDQSHSTWFLRNIPQTRVLGDLIIAKENSKKTLNIASIGCSTGAELYSNLFILKDMCKGHQFISVGVDISAGVVDIAKNGIYRSDKASSAGLGTYYEGEFELSHLNENNILELFDIVESGYKIKPWISSDTKWLCMSASDSRLVTELGEQDIVFAKNFLGPMDSQFAEECFLNVLKLVKVGGYLIIDGVDLDVKCRVLSSINVTPILDNYKSIYHEDETKRGWPWVRWSHEPIDDSRIDWRIRYCSIFKVN